MEHTLDWVAENWQWIVAIIIPIITTLLQRFGWKKTADSLQSVVHGVDDFRKRNPALAEDLKNAIKTRSMNRGTEEHLERVVHTVLGKEPPPKKWRAEGLILLMAALPVLTGCALLEPMSQEEAWALEASAAQVEAGMTMQRARTVEQAEAMADFARDRAAKAARFAGEIVFMQEQASEDGLTADERRTIQARVDTELAKDYETISRNLAAIKDHAVWQETQEAWRTVNLWITMVLGEDDFKRRAFGKALEYGRSAGIIDTPKNK